MKLLFRIHILAAVFAALWVLPSPLKAQPNLLELFPKGTKEWQRVSTDADSTTDVGAQTLILEPNGIFRATFRIQLGKSERAPEKPDVKYKTRLMTVQFDSRKNVYRIFETILLDSTGKEVYTSGQLTDSAWKKGSGFFYGAAANLSPLGDWKVISSSETGATERVTRITTQLDRFEVGRMTCSPPDYESASMTREELVKAAGVWAGNIEMSNEKVNVVKIKCSSPKLASEIHTLVLKSLDRAILLSGGAVYGLERLVGNY